MREQSNSSLGETLRGLPLRLPDRDVWSQLVGELAPPARRRTWPIFAAAAVVLVAVAAMLTLPHRPPATDTLVASSNDASTNKNGNANVTMTTDDKNSLTALQSRSRELEQWLNQTAGAAAPLPGGDLAAATEIESLIGVVDIQLAAPDQRDEAKLWRRRVDLLEDLTTLRYSNYRLAESDAIAAGRPATWIN
jgi:hypothetical protein